MRARLSCQQNNTCSNVVVTDQLRSARRGWESGALPPSPHYGRIGSPASSASWCALKTNGTGIAACTAIASFKAQSLRNKGWRVGNQKTARQQQDDTQLHGSQETAPQTAGPLPLPQYKINQINKAPRE